MCDPQISLKMGGGGSGSGFGIRAMQITILTLTEQINLASLKVVSTSAER